MSSVAFVATLAAACTRGAEPASFDWPQWRGPARNGVSAETEWSWQWPTEGPKPLWKAAVGVGYATIAVSHECVYVNGNENNIDTIFCLNANTGAVIWKYAYPSALEPNSHAGGPGSTPTVNGGRVYTLSKHGLIFCLDAQAGTVAWSKDAVKDFGAPKPQWAFSSSPLIVGDTLLLNAMGGGLALNKNSGELLWKGAGTSGYASPVSFKQGGRDGVAFFGKEALVGVALADGARLWEFPWKTSWGENTPDPLVIGADGLYVSTGHGLGATLLKLAAQDGPPTTVWANKAIGNHISSAVLRDKYIYGFTGLVHRKGVANLSCTEAATGTVKWTQDGLLGQLVLAGDKLIMLTTEGELIVAEASPEKYIELARAKVLEAKPGDGKAPPRKCWTVPVLSNGRIYCRNASGDLVCLNVAK